MSIRNLISLLLISITISSYGQTQQFSQREQQSISTETPGLFDRSDAFTVDFGQMRQSEYSFPLPVGKISGIRKNNNVTITTTEGDAVKSMFGGTVRMSRQLDQWGNTIVIRHDNGLETVYGNNAQNLVKVGERVKAGQTIAIVGTRDGKAYCEFAVMVNGARFNPETLIELNSHRLRSQTLLFKKQEQGVKITVMTEEKEQTVKNNKRQKQLGNMSERQNAQIKTNETANEKYKKNSEHMAQAHDDLAFFDIDEYQAIQFEKKVLTPYDLGNEFTIDFKRYKDTEWCYPMKDSRVISPFGGRRRHAGTDIKSKAGEPIFAAFDGEVILSGQHYGYGLCIVIRHANGLETLYSHQSKNMVKVGDWVKAGQQIGVVGRSGRATTEHCHFEVRCNGRPFDSSKIFDHANNTIRRETLVFKKTGRTTTISSVK
ncbi:MAG: M23 family metallopeptidase [Prevotella sp.]|nr:M23 family metallopeptidase [Bacteroidales bacterium]MDY5876805.1 M23 family metallopeptidase [Prevotella sp.]